MIRNEKIIELADQAGFDIKLLLEPYPSGFPNEDFLALKSFAELIVKECSQFVEDKFDFCGDELIIAEQIKEHFGVE